MNELAQVFRVLLSSRYDTGIACVKHFVIFKEPKFADLVGGGGALYVLLCIHGVALHLRAWLRSTYVLMQCIRKRRTCEY